MLFHKEGEYKKKKLIKADDDCTGFLRPVINEKFMRRFTVPSYATG